jgi:PTH1 family peptidyl-tRNA hydrolase
MSWMIFGLGNIGSRYRFTRHNVGFMVVDELAKQFGVEFKEERKIAGRVAKVLSNQQSVLLIKPSTFVNRSGECVRHALNFYKGVDKQVLIVCDDIALPFKALRVREKGSAGGHNGLKSVEQALQKQEYFRLRMGVGGKAEEQDLADYVLASFTDIEQVELPSFIKLGAKVALRITEEPIAQVMNEVN